MGLGIEGKVMHYKETKYGFEYGAARIERAVSDDKRGWVVLDLETPKRKLSIYITKTGKVRIFDNDKKDTELVLPRL